MANTAHTVGKGRVVTPAPTSARGSRAKTIALAVARANAVNAKRRVRQFATNDGLVTYLDSLPTKRMPAELVNDKTASGAVARREWCEANGIAPVRVYDDGIGERRATTPPTGTNDWRPENAVRERLRSLAGIGARFGYTRAETAPVQTATVVGLDWSKGLPDHFHGADAVYIYRI